MTSKINKSENFIKYGEIRKTDTVTSGSKVINDWDTRVRMLNNPIPSRTPYFWSLTEKRDLWSQKAKRSHNLNYKPFRSLKDYNKVHASKKR